MNFFTLLFLAGTDFPRNPVVEDFVNVQGKIPIKKNNSDHIYHQYSILLDVKINRMDFQAYLFH